MGGGGGPAHQGGVPGVFRECSGSVPGFHGGRLLGLLFPYISKLRVLGHRQK